jgi:hypothetical protein
MNERFDELTKGLAQSVSRRQALRRFGYGLAGIALAWLGLATVANADTVANAKRCNNCVDPFGCDYTDPNFAACYNYCYAKCCPKGCGP